MLFILAFMLFETIGMPRKLSGPRLADNRFISRFTSFGADIRRYVLVLTWINFLVGVGNAIFLAIIGVDFPILWGLLAWLMGYICQRRFLVSPYSTRDVGHAEFGVALHCSCSWVMS